MTKAERVGSLSARSHYTDGRLATDLLKINAPDLRQSRSVSFPILVRMIALHSPVNIEREPLASAVRERILLRIKQLKINDDRVCHRGYLSYADVKG